MSKTFQEKRLKRWIIPTELLYGLCDSNYLCSLDIQHWAILATLWSWKLSSCSINRFGLERKLNANSFFIRWLLYLHDLQRWWAWVTLRTNWWACHSSQSPIIYSTPKKKCPCRIPARASWVSRNGERSQKENSHSKKNCRYLILLILLNIYTWLFINIYCF